MSWAIGLGIIFGSFVIVYVVAEVIHSMNPLDETDWVAHNKRLTGKRARKLSGEFRSER